MADKNQVQAPIGATAIKPPEYHGVEWVRRLLYNPDTGEVLTRTPKSWGLITIFYLIYYSCLAAFWAAMMQIFFQTLDWEKPKWQNSASLIGVSPGLGMQPSQPAEFIDSSMIKYDSSDANSYSHYVEASKNFLGEKYSQSAAGIKFDTSKLGNCQPGQFGYDAGKPCIFLKLNKIYGLEHNYIDGVTKGDYDGQELEWPKDMPESLKTHIKAQSDKEQVWVNCKAKNPADADALPESKISYYPETKGFPKKIGDIVYMPYTNQKVDGKPAYQSPLVAVQFDVSGHKGQLLHIECRAWAHNIGYSRRDKIGINSLEILVL